MIHYHGQILAMNECGYRQTYLANYLLVQDLDEFVVPSVADSWSAMLDHAHSTMSSPAADRVASYSFRNRFFPLQFPDDVDQASTKAGFKGGVGQRASTRASQQRRASCQTVHILFLANDRCLRRCDLVEQNSSVFSLIRMTWMQIRLNVLGGHGSARLMGPHGGGVSAKAATHEMEKNAWAVWGP